MKRSLVVLALLAGCGDNVSGELVALNERIFADGERSAGCFLYRFNSDQRTNRTGDGLVVNHRVDGDRVVVTVSEQDEDVLSTSYTEGFFAATVVRLIEVGGKLIVSHWGRVGPECDPLDAPGPR